MAMLVGARVTSNLGRCSGNVSLGLRRHPKWRSPWDRSLVCHYSKKNKRENIPGVSPEYQEDVSRILEQADRASSNWDIGYTDFLTPPVCAQAAKALEVIADVSGFSWGGYPQAERCRMVVGREEQVAPLLPEDSEAVAALQVEGNFMFDPATHRDFLGSILGTGIVRDKIGDIIVMGEQGAQILTVPELVGHFETSLTQVRSVSVTTSQIPLSKLKFSPPKVQETKTVEASMRLDAVASAGFRMSRSKMVDLIKSGDVRVNWESGSKASYEVKQGDMVSVSGKGRLEIQAVSETKKGKFAVEMVRYV